ncbi:MAG: C10 family peptidase [Muribaculaceae bacterium]|nr:C10 family peptidase [Muribaculaceae bacterium]
MKLIPKKSILLTGFTHRYIKDLDYDCTYSEGALDVTKFLSNLRNGYPHIMAGVEKGAYAGHAWLVDGYREDNLGYYFHTNWGWYGVDNSWVYGNPYSTNPSAYEPEKTPRIFSESLQHIYIN